MGGPEFIAIPPTELAHRFQQKMHLILAPVLRRSPAYQAYYTKRSDAGDYVILDNGAYEDGESIGIDELIQWARRVSASEVVLPDVLYQPAATLKLTRDALLRLQENPLPKSTNIMIVPQGRSKGEWQWCLDEMWSCCRAYGYHNPVIGIAKHTTLWAHSSTGRIDLIRTATLYDARIHLLGTDTTLQELPHLAYVFNHVRSIDSSKPIVYACYGIGLQGGQPPTHSFRAHRPDKYFSYTAKDLDVDLAISNVESVRSLLHFLSNLGGIQHGLAAGE